ncbi:MAG: DUF3567 family protein [Dechloromonas sp.]|jgi:hypothetical protein|uniref:DUF3567 family protein n=1 Tax=Candidatus Dechloromonas phosphorivorans TaxID=2899244 RepID=A0A935K0Z2_9RHOO|nr:DUF3567 family protein [Candidatus Dechloromonas phosphorivorans]
MNVIYSSKHFWILSYPEQQGFELFDKYHLRTLFLDGASAQNFRHAMEEIPESQRNEEEFDAWLDGLCDENAQPIVFH